MFARRLLRCFAVSLHVKARPNGRVAYSSPSFGLGGPPAEPTRFSDCAWEKQGKMPSALITRIVGTHRYQLTSGGRRIIVAVLSALRSTVAQLTPVTAQLTGVAA